MTAAAFEAMLCSPRARFYEHTCEECEAQLFAFPVDEDGAHCNGCGALTCHPEPKEGCLSLDWFSWLHRARPYCSFDCGESPVSQHACKPRRNSARGGGAREDAM